MLAFSSRAITTKTFVVEHLDPELGPWSALEYQTIVQECHASGHNFCLSSVPKTLELPAQLNRLTDLNVEHRSVEEIYASDKDRVCLLDPAATEKLSPKDAASFDIFLFGGILGDDPPRGKPTVFLLQNSLLICADRTSELRKKGFTGRKLGPIQMTTDTAVRVTRMVIQQQGFCL